MRGGALSRDEKQALVMVVIGNAGVVRSENTQSLGYRHAPGDPTAIQEPAALKRLKAHQRRAGGLGLDQMRLGVLCADPPSPLRCAPCNYADRRLHFTGRGCGLLLHRCKVRHPRPIWKVLAASTTTRSRPALLGAPAEVRTVLVEAK